MWISSVLFVEKFFSVKPISFWLGFIKFLDTNKSSGDVKDRKKGALMK